MDIAELKRRCDAVLPRATALATVVQFDPEEPEHRRGMARELLAELPAQAAAVSELIAEIERLRDELVRAQEEMRERCAEFCESSDIQYEIGRTCAVGIRALEVKP